MPPENLAGFRERLATLEAQHKAMEKEHVMSVSSLSDRLNAHIEETDRQFATFSVTTTNTQVSIDTLTSTVDKFISAHNAMDQGKGDKVREWFGVLTPWVFAIAGLLYFYVSNGGKP